MIALAALIVLSGCALLAHRILRAQHGRRERDPDVEEALEQIRVALRRPAVVIAAASVFALVLVAVLVRNPSRWPVLLLALAVLFSGVVMYVVAERRRQ
ncbi:MAG TPA: hypothetical protein VMY78_11720 [Solirubrobacteraceae bacterium]|nr:hypothetical protein [Solirubrobacteraceae bacterium]